MGDGAFDLVIHGGTVVTASETFRGDLGIRDGRIAVVAERIAGGRARVDAGGRLVMPGGIETHCHMAQESSSGIMTTTAPARCRRPSAATPAACPSRRSSAGRPSTR